VTQAPAEGISVRRYATAEEFLRVMEPLLLQQDVRYGLMLGLALAVRERPDAYGDAPPFLATVEDSQGVAAAALMTPPYGVILYSERVDPRPGLDALAAHLASAGWTPPTANGPDLIPAAFAQAWTAATGAQAEVAMHERLFELRQVSHPAYSPGHMRQATLDDLDLVARWTVEFTVEAFGDLEPVDPEAARRGAERSIRNGVIFLWDDGGPVSLARTSRPTPHGISIGPVYTPPIARGRGYATSCVAQLSQRLLDQGKAYVTLFTDLANPTSNRIYQKIGYQPVCDYTVYRFTHRRRATQCAPGEGEAAR
jgi:predicted GNAT family acetyltransferase